MVFSINHKNVQENTNPDGNGVNNSGQNGVPVTGNIRPVLTSTVSPGEVHSDGHPITSDPIVGPQVATGASSGAIGSGSENFGYRTSTGTAIEIDGTPGNETISLQHHSGSGILIDSDGGVHISSGGTKSGGIQTQGDLYMDSGGNLVIKSTGTVSIAPSSDLNINVPGTLNIKADSIITRTNNLTEIVDGYASREVTNDQSLIVGGNDRKTVAGDARLQISSTYQEDIQGTHTTRSNGNMLISTKGDMDTVSKGKYSLGGKTKTEISSDGNVEIKNSGSFLTASDGPVSIQGSEVQTHPAVTYSLNTNKSFTGGGIQYPGGSSGASASVINVDAKTPDANDIIDEMTSKRKIPEFEGNAKRQSSDTGSILANKNENVPGASKAFKEYSSKNSGYINQATSTEGGGKVPTSIIKNTSISVEPSKSTWQIGEKISKHYTLRDLINTPLGTKNVPSEKYKNMVMLAMNVLDPLRDKFPNLHITNIYKKGAKNHDTGKAVDIEVQTPNASDQHEGIAVFARDNLPVSQVFIEKTDSGRTHVHLMVAEAGSKINPSVLTCNDKECSSPTSGINVPWLKSQGEI